MREERRKRRVEKVKEERSRSKDKENAHYCVREV